MPEVSPTVSIVFLVFNRRDELRESLRRMLVDSDYDRGRVEVIVVDNASSDGSGAMVSEAFPDVRLIRREVNVGVSGWNDGFAAASGDYVLALDDDCYLPPDGLGRAVDAALEHDADLVSFAVVSDKDRSFAFTDEYRTGLLTFWGCAVLMRRRVLDALGGYDPEIFVWANEVEFMLRFYDSGFRHLHLPGLAAIHMKAPEGRDGRIPERAYRLNARHFGYVVGKFLRPIDALSALVGLTAFQAKDGLRHDSVAFRALPETARGFVHGLRHREGLAHPAISATYRRDFVSFVPPWKLARPVGELIRAIPREALGRFVGRDAPPQDVGRREEFFATRRTVYPEHAATLDFS